MAGEDKKLLAQLERFPSPVDLARKIREQDALIAAGAHKKPLTKDSTPEEIAQYRKDNNIPESADKYDLKLKDGMVIGESDKPIIDKMLGAMHGMNLTNDQAKTVIESYYQQEQAFLVERDNDIAKNKTKQDDTLRAEWGQEYRTNVTTFENMAKMWSVDTNHALAGALDSNGMPLLNNAAFLKDMVIMARTINPFDTVVSGTGGNQMASVDDEIKKIEARMGGVDPTYVKDEAAQKRYRELVGWKENQKKVS